MRWSLANVASIALVGLGAVLSGTNAVPVDLISTSDLKYGLPNLPALNARGGIIIGGKGGFGGKGGDEGGEGGEGGHEGGDGEGEGTGSGSGGSGGSKGAPNAGGFASLNGPRSGKTYAPKDVPNPFDSTHNYKDTPNMIPNKVYGTVHKVYGQPDKAGNRATVDLIGINKKDNSISVLDANNKDDKPASGKMYLSDIEMGLFKAAGKTPQDLAIVRFETVVEPTTRSAMQNALKTLGKDASGSATVKSTDTGAAGDVFDSLLATPFGSNVDRLNQEFSTGKSIDSFFVDMGDAKQLVVTLK